MKSHFFLHIKLFTFFSFRFIDFHLQKPRFQLWFHPPIARLENAPTGRKSAPGAVRGTLMPGRLGPSHQCEENMTSRYL
jgi:hypothetical protein